MTTTVSLKAANSLAEDAVEAGLATYDDAGGGTYVMGPELIAVRGGIGGAPTFASMSQEEANAVEAAILG
jgi:hypothetical protein